MASQEQGSLTLKTRSVRLTFSPQKPRWSTAMAHLTPEVVKLLRAAPARTKAVCDLRGCWAEQSRVDHRREQEVPVFGRYAQESRTPDISAHSSAVTISEVQSCPSEHVCSETLLAESSRYHPPPAYLTILHTFFTPDKLTKWENKLKGKTLLAMRKLNKQIEEAQIRRDLVLEETRQIFEEKLLVQAENKFLLEYLAKKNTTCRRQHEEQWKEYFQKCREIEQTRQELSSKFAKQMSILKTQVLQGKKTQSNLKQQLQALRNISLVKERQDLRIEALQKEEEKIKSETYIKDQKAHFQFLQQNALLEKQLNELHTKHLRKRKRKIRSKVQMLEAIAQKSNYEFCLGISRENQELRKELGQLIQVSKKLEATQSQLKNQKQLLKQEQWYQECLIRGKQRLKAGSNWCPKEEGAPNTSPSPPLGSKPRRNPK